ncbi:hypothetical protein RJ639_027651 [Escallonia herrerae]|uniref:BRI1 kinase inhibitor 1 n=1 Tax=Escallonia herrerae TaxID=1293975 RepID=A0AA88X3U1_9ASTE|nr:hypothetical protein RJ639_027651 [Escallonia herrerae]
METQNHQKTRDKVEEKKREGGKSKQEGKEGAVPPQTTTVSPPSASSSPSHEFSFTISLHPTPPPTTTKNLHDKAKSTPHPPASLAIDLSPADEIFFHGHLLPLHLLSHLPVSPRSSTNSLDSFTLPIKELVDDQQNAKTTSTSTNSKDSSSIPKDGEKKGCRTKAKSFSLFSKWRKGCEVGDKEEPEREKKKQRFDVSHVIKRYMRMVRPLFRGRRSNMELFERQPYSFSGNLSMRSCKQEVRGKRGEFSAPASMRTSPTNSGLLVPIPTSASDSTMEELQAAIQAAITHCKNSIAVEEKISAKVS